MFNNTVSITVDEEQYDYGLISVVNSDSQRSNPAADVGSPDFLRIAHESKGKNTSAVKRHLVRIDTTKPYTAPNGETQVVTISAYLVLVVPDRVEVTNADVKLAYDKLVTFVGGTESGQTATNFERLLAGEP